MPTYASAYFPDEQKFGPRHMSGQFRIRQNPSKICWKKFRTRQSFSEICWNCYMKYVRSGSERSPKNVGTCQIRTLLEMLPQTQEKLPGLKPGNIGLLSRKDWEHQPGNTDWEHQPVIVCVCAFVKSQCESVLGTCCACAFTCVLYMRVVLSVRRRVCWSQNSSSELSSRVFSLSRVLTLLLLREMGAPPSCSSVDCCVYCW